MSTISRSFVALALAAGLSACSDVTTTPTARLTPGAAGVEMARIKATDSTMALTSTAFSDTSLVLKRFVPLPAAISKSLLIGPGGGEIKIDEAGGKIDIPAGALSETVLITMTAFAGADVAYDFQPHGLVFAKPVKIQQAMAGTWAQEYPQLLKKMHGSYYGTSLEEAWLDPDHYLAKVQENQLGYVESNGSQVKFYIGHFSGYMFSCGLL